MGIIGGDIMIRINNLTNNPNLRLVEQKKGIQVLEYTKDLSVDPDSAIRAYYASEMNIRKRQVYIELNHSGIVVSAGAMQWMAGKVEAGSDIKGVGDFLGKAFKSSVTKESTVKPRYYGEGSIMLEPTYKHILLENVEEWKDGLVLEDGLFLACEDTIKQTVVARSNLSSAVLGKEGLFNLALKGNGVAVLESPVPREELIEIELENDVMKIDGSYAVAWSGSLSFTVEKSTKSLIGSAVSGEGFVNVYRGSGKILMAPV